MSEALSPKTISFLLYKMGNFKLRFVCARFVMVMCQLEGADLETLPFQGFDQLGLTLGSKIRSGTVPKWPF
jgi:hypothetical protein